MIFRLSTSNLIFALSLILPQFAHADIVLSGTRFIYTSNDSEINVQVKNKGKMPALLQSWIDVGDSGIKAEKVETPFILTPPVTRVDPGQGQTLRIIYNNKPLPGDRESVFWVNVLEIPAKAKKSAEEKSKESKNQLQLAFRTRVKMFYRPDHLPGEAAKAPVDAKLSLVTTPKESQIHVVNDSAFSISYSSIILTRGEEKIQVSGALVEAKSTFNFTLPKKLQGSGWQAEWFAVNDFGGEITGRKSL